MDIRLENSPNKENILSSTQAASLSHNKITQDKNNNFNFLRLVFAILVLLSHSPEIIDGNRNREILTRIFGTLSFGDFAVQGFFILSGYMIVKSWLQDPELNRYLKKRVARIYPGFIIATVFSVFLIGWLGATDRLTYVQDINYSKFIINLIILLGPFTPKVFEGTAYAIVNAPMWTLEYEFRCYILIGILGIWGINSRRNIWLNILFITLFALFASYFFDINKYHFPGSFYLLGIPSEILRLFPCFATGVCFYLYREKIVYSFRLFFIFFTLLIAGLFIYKVAVIAFCIAGGYCIFYFSTLKIRAIKIFQKLPDISYGIYLYGWPVQKIIMWYFASISPWQLFFASWIVSSILGLCSWYLVESPALKLVAKYRVARTDIQL